MSVYNKYNNYQDEETITVDCGVAGWLAAGWWVWPRRLLVFCGLPDTVKQRVSRVDLCLSEYCVNNLIEEGVKSKKV